MTLLTVFQNNFNSGISYDIGAFEFDTDFNAVQYRIFNVAGFTLDTVFNVNVYDREYCSFTQPPFELYMHYRMLYSFYKMYGFVEEDYPEVIPDVPSHSHDVVGDIEDLQDLQDNDYENRNDEFKSSLIKDFSVVPLLAAEISIDIAGFEFDTEFETSLRNGLLGLLHINPRDYWTRLSYFKQSIVDSNLLLISNQVGIYQISLLSIVNEIRSPLEGVLSDNLLKVVNTIDKNDLFQGLFSIATSLPAYSVGILPVSLSISEGFTGLFGVTNSVAEGFGTLLSIVNEISITSDLSSVFNVRNSVSDISVSFHSQPYQIYLDGVEVSRLIGSEITIEISEDSTHNSISFSSISQELFEKANPAYKEGEPRIRVILGSRDMQFLLEERSISAGEVSYWGRDITARDAAPWAVLVQTQTTEWISAHTFMESLLSYSTINWEISDWALPDTYACEGYPVDIISDLIAEVGAILRAEDDGSLTARYKYPVRPVHLGSTVADLTYNESKVVGASIDRSVGEHYNIVSVSCDVDDRQAPILVLEEVVGDRIIGTDSYIKSFWFEKNPNSLGNVIETFVTDGSIKFVKTGKETFVEYVTFNGGIGSVQYPIYSIINIDWIGKTGTVNTWNQYSQEISLVEPDNYKIAKVTYTSEYYEYLCTGHYVEELLAAFNLDSTFNSTVKVITSKIAKDSFDNLIDKIGSDISVRYVTDESLLVKRGETWIDENKYNMQSVSFDSPFNESLKDGMVIWLDADRLTSGQVHVENASISIQGPRIVNNVRIKKWEV